MTLVCFQNVFYKCIEGKSSIYLLLAMSIGNDWMVDLMIIYIEKTIAKGLDINDIIKENLWGWNLKIKYTLNISIIWGQPP